MFQKIGLFVSAHKPLLIEITAAVVGAAIGAVAASFLIVHEEEDMNDDGLLGMDEPEEGEEDEEPEEGEED